MRLWAHDFDLGPRPIQDLGSDWMPFCFVSVEQSVRCLAADGCGQFPPEVHGVAEPGVEPLTSERGLNVCCIAREQDAPDAVSRHLLRTVGPACGYMQGGECDVGAGDAA
jgi:hypothetical protein